MRNAGSVLVSIVVALTYGACAHRGGMGGADDGGATLSDGDVTPSPDGPGFVGGSGDVRWAEIPDLIFVRGFAETEQLGLFMIDIENRWSPGDLDNTAQWKSRFPLSLQIASGPLSGITLDDSSGALRYDGSGTGSETATVQLSAHGIPSGTFRVRILAPTAVWGTGAKTRFPGKGYDPADGLASGWNAVQQATLKTATDDAPNVWLVLDGDYTDSAVTEQRIRFASHLAHLYVVGEPGKRPILRHGSLTGDFCRRFYVKNFELVDFNLNEAIKYTDGPGFAYFTRLYQHDEEGENNGISSPNYEADEGAVVGADVSWTTHIWNFEGAQNGGKGNTRHQFYMEGRPNTSLYVNNIKVHGTRGCSIIKSTRKTVKVRNSSLSALLDPADPTQGLRAVMLIDIVSCGEHTIYNNELTGAYDTTRGGTQAGLVSIRARREWFGADEPAYPDVSYSPAVTSITNGGYSAPPGFTAGAATFVDPTFWAAVGAVDIKDPANPYSFKHYLSYNRFTWVNEPGGKRAKAYRNDGTAPRTPVAQFATNEKWPRVPWANGTMVWRERSIGFFANNTYAGWVDEDMIDELFELDYQGNPDPQLTDAQSAWPPPKREVSVLGGESGPMGMNPLITVPDWFKE